MGKNKYFQLAGNFPLRLLISAVVALPVVWINETLDIQPLWTLFIAFAVILSAEGKRRYPPQWIYGLLLLTEVLPFLLTYSTVQTHPYSAGVYVLTVLLLSGLHWLYTQPDAATKLALITFSLAFSLLIANIAAGMMLEDLKEKDRQKHLPPVQAKAVDSEPEANSESEATLEQTVESPVTETIPETPQPTLTPTLLPSPVASEESVTESPEDEQVDSPPPVERPVAGYGYMDFIENNGYASWSHLTGVGPPVNSTLRAYMVDVEGHIVYDNVVSYNAHGMRCSECGEPDGEIRYDKPENTYRILIIGDSFVEAIQVPYEQTFPALLQAELDTYSTPERQFEVLAMGRTGWGTLQEYIYYYHVGHKYQADLVILSFFINDVADNFPDFYPDINNTNFEYLFEGDEVRMVDTNLQPLPPNRARILYNALPEILQKTNLARLYIRLGDPPQPIMTLGGVMTRVHPQFYIYVTDPEPEGYTEGWERTGQALQLLSSAVERDNGQLAVMPIFLGQEAVQNVSGWFPEVTAGWQWDDGLPEKKLTDILHDLPADLLPTRPVYEAYADSVNGQVNDLLYLSEDGHFNTLGHGLTVQVILTYLQEKGIISPE